MNVYRDQITGALKATSLHSTCEYSWFGELCITIPPRLKKAFTPDDARNLLLSSLQSRLYSNFYCLGFAVPGNLSVNVLDVQAVPFVEQLAAANCGRGFSESNSWRIQKSQDNQIIVQRDGFNLWVRPKECLNPPKALARGMRISLRFPQVLPSISPGFCTVLSNKAWPVKESTPVTRFYWNLTAAGAPRFLHTLTCALNAANLPFRVKVPSHPVLFNRCDAGVLYLPDECCKRACESLPKIYKKIAPYLKNGVPVLSCPITPGLAWAEGPEDDESFGAHRCYMVADGMLRAFEQGKKSLQARLQVVEARFKEAGINLEAPFLNPGSPGAGRFDLLASRLLRISGRLA